MKLSAKSKGIVLTLSFFFWTASYAQAQFQIKEIVQRAVPAVVTVYSFDESGGSIGLGSGFVVRSDGLIVSNYHVIRGAHFVNVEMMGGEMYRVSGVVELDPQRDYVVLKIRGFSLPTVTLGNANLMEIGDPVVAIGNPRGLEHTVSDGIVSQVRSQDGYTQLQVTTPISPGSSGGPLFNMRGEVVGITTSGILEGQNLNFALPINYVRGSLQESTSVQYTLGEIAEAQQEYEERQLAEAIVKLFAAYEDPDGLFALVYPRAWNVQRSTRLDNDGVTYHHTTMFAPPDAYQANVDGYLSEGMRIHFQYPPEGQVWTMSTTAEWGPVFLQNILELNPGFTCTSRSSVQFGAQEAHIYSFVGENENILEPEKTTFVVIANERYRLSVELVSPASKLSDYNLIYQALLETFELKAL